MIDDIGDSLHELHGLACTVAVPDADVVTTTVRCQAAQSSDMATRNARRDRMTAVMYLLISAVAVAPGRGAIVTVTAAGPAWVGAWTLVAEAEPTAQGEWRCLVQREATRSLLAAPAGSPRPVSA